MDADFETFLDLLVKEERLAEATVRTWRSAVKAVSAGVDFDPEKSDVEESLAAFFAGQGAKLAANTQAVYRSRVTRAVEAYRKWLADPAARPEQRGPGTSSLRAGTIVTYEPMPGYTAELPLPPRITATELSALLASLVRDA